MRGEAVALRLCTRLPSSFRAHTITCWLADTSAAPDLLSPLGSLTTASEGEGSEAVVAVVVVVVVVVAVVVVVEGDMVSKVNNNTTW